MTDILQGNFNLYTPYYSIVIFSLDNKTLTTDDINGIVAEALKNTVNQTSITNYSSYGYCAIFYNVIFEKVTPRLQNYISKQVGSSNFSFLNSTQSNFLKSITDDIQQNITNGVNKTFYTYAYYGSMTQNLTAVDVSNADWSNQSSGLIDVTNSTNAQKISNILILQNETFELFGIAEIGIGIMLLIVLIILFLLKRQNII